MHEFSHVLGFKEESFPVNYGISGDRDSGRKSHALPSKYEIELIKEVYGLRQGKIYLLRYDWQKGEWKEVLGYLLLDSFRSIGKVALVAITGKNPCTSIGCQSLWTMAFISPGYHLVVAMTKTHGGVPDAEDGDRTGFEAITRLQEQVYVKPFWGTHLFINREAVLVYNNHGKFREAATFVSLGYDPVSERYILIVTKGAGEMEVFFF
jgi:hypothetical protein